MGNIGLYTQVTDFTCVNAGTSEWCKAEKNGRLYFVKKFLSPVYPTRELALTEDKFNKRSARFHKKFQELQQFYNELNHQNFSGVLVLPEEVISFQYHICTISPFISANIKPEQVCRLSPWQKTVILRTLTLAVMNVHQAGVVHGDLKPENVMITQNPENGSCQLKLIDFDESFYEKDPPVSFVRGDPSYFAPEAYAHEENNAIRLDHRMDIFALGIMYHFFWCGKLPGKPAGQTIGETVLRGGKITLSDEIPEELRNLIQGMMNVRPDKRPVLQFAYDFTLKKLLDSLPVQIVNLQPSVPVKKKNSGHKNPLRR